jgi:hypothetical protein
VQKLFAVSLALSLALPAVAAELPIRPDPKMTPGAVLTTDTGTICTKGYAKTVRHTSGKLKAKIYREYGIDKTASHFEVDHLISLELGGADVAANLWPESYDTVSGTRTSRTSWRIDCTRWCAPVRCRLRERSTRSLPIGSRLTRSTLETLRLGLRRPRSACQLASSTPQRSGHARPQYRSERGPIRRESWRQAQHSRFQVELI